VPVAGPGALRAGYERYVRSILKLVHPVAVVATEDTSPTIKQLVGSLEIVDPATPISIGALSAAPRAEIAALQLTSGSTRDPCAVQLGWAGLERQLGLVRSWLKWEQADAAASWLPLHHDMGFIGMFLSAICLRAPLWALQPKQFLQEPIRWLECLGRYGAAITAAPTFAYSYVVRRVARSDLAGLDFAGWRSALVGAERVRPEPLASFAQLLAPHGFRPETLRPGYGLAEATLAVTGHPSGAVPRMVRIGGENMQPGKPVEIFDERPLTDLDTRGVRRRPDASGLLTSSGRCLPGVEIRVLDDDGTAAPPGVLGEIVISSPSLARGYFGDGAQEKDRFSNGWLKTGDLGFVHNDELFVVGRISDALNVHGVLIVAEELEARIATRLGLHATKCVVVPWHGPDSSGAAVVIESEPGPWVTGVARLLRSHIGAQTPVAIYCAPRRWIPVTTSGKPRRRELARRLSDSGSAGSLVFSSRGRELSAAGGRFRQ
jgi:acyl-CoA synthetase (AMP-forming)/AMP-acid ligase II